MNLMRYRKILLACLASGCAPNATAPRPAPEPPAATTPDPTEPGVTPSEPKPPWPRDAEICAALERDAVASSAPKPGVLYTWTTKEQVRDLKRHRRLLTRTHAANGDLSLFDQRLKKSKDPIAKQLRSGALKYRRFAWANAWATVMGWDTYTYGRDLIRVTLKPNAIIARFDSALPDRWAFYDLEGKAVAKADALAHPERIGAVYHVFHAQDDGAPRDVSFREFVLCNESMVEDWEIATHRLDSELSSWVQNLTLLHEALSMRAAVDVVAWRTRLTLKTWREPRANERLEDAFGAGIAFVNSHYAPTAASIEDLIETLALRRQTTEQPFSHRARVKFSEQHVIPAPPPPPKPSPFCDPTMGPCP